MKKIRFLIAYAGSGKSHLKKMIGDRVIDADFGTYRKALTGKHFWELDSEEIELITLSYLEHYLEIIDESRSDVILMTNDLLPAKYILDLVTNGTILPSEVELQFTYPSLTFDKLWFQTLQNRDGDSELIKALRVHKDEWRYNWLSTIENLCSVASCLGVSHGFTFLNKWLDSDILNKLFPHCAS